MRQTELHLTGEDRLVIEGIRGKDCINRER